MSQEMEEAKVLLEKLNKDFGIISKRFSENFSPENFEEVNQVYFTATQLNVLTSQLVDKGSTKIYEGTIKVNNRQAIVTIDGFDIRGNIKFEIMYDGEWMKGYRENSQYGQIFVGERASTILHNKIIGRVTLPLVLY